MVEFRLLGPVGVWLDGCRVDLGPAESGKARCLLAALLRTPGGWVATDTLTGRVWGEEPVGAAVRYKYAGWLRAVLAPLGVPLEHRDGAYRLPVVAEQVDVGQFRRLVTEGQRALRGGEPALAGLCWEKGLRLWRGTPLASLPGSWAELFRSQLRGERRDVAVARFRVLLSLGQHAQAAGELGEWLADYPVDDSLAELGMLAAYRNGDIPQALEIYRGQRERTREMLGADPSRSLADLARRIQARDPALERPQSAAATVAGSALAAAPVVRGEAVDLSGPRGGVAASPLPPPRHLPGAVSHFTGRLLEQQRLAGLVEEGRSAAPGGAVCVITGMAGVGKTALAVHMAHRLAGRFPDGQLYANLRGFAPSGQPVRPAEVLGGFLDALGLDSPRIPSSPEARAALFRTLLADKQMIILLDDARDAEQVRPLLPGASAGCLVLVTSRIDLAGLVATVGAHLISLGALSDAESGELLAHRLGPGRLSAEPQAAEELAIFCAGLPLALSVAAARLAARPTFSVCDLVEQLRDVRQRLAALETGEAVSGLRAVFAASRRWLSPPAGLLLTLLGVHPGPELSLAAAASLLGVSRQVARGALAELAAANLLSERTPGRFTCHDLIRAYAAERAAEDAQGSQVAFRRVLDHYLHTASAASLLLEPGREPVPLEPVTPGAAVERLTDPDEALAWFDSERKALLAMAGLAAEAGFADQQWQLAWALVSYFHRRGHWNDWAGLQQDALRSAERSGNRLGQAHCHRQIGHTCVRQGLLEDAVLHYRQALRLSKAIAEPHGQAHALLGMARVNEHLQRHAQSLRQAKRALTVFEGLGELAGQVAALNAIGWSQAHLGAHQQAIVSCRAALAASRKLGEPRAEGAVQDSLGYAYFRAGRLAEALDCYDRAVQVFRVAGERCYEAECLMHAADVHQAARRPAQARRCWQASLAIYEGLADARAEEVRTRLRQGRGAVASVPR